MQRAPSPKWKEAKSQNHCLEGPLPHIQYYVNGREISYCVLATKSELFVIAVSFY